MLIAVLVAGTTAAFGFVAYINSMLSRDATGQILNIGALSDVIVDRHEPEDPFWMVLAGTDWDEDGNGILRTDVILLAYINPIKKEAALISIPRDTLIDLDGYGYQKINAAYTYGCIEAMEGYDNSGPAMLIQEVSKLTGAEISGYAQCDFDGFVGVVDALGGVAVDVPLDIIGDREAGPVDVYAGEQVLDGWSALVFVRSRQYEIGDYQRQANQRAMLQAIARQVLSEDPGTILNTVTAIAQMTTTNMKVEEIANIAISLRGMQETDIHTYSLLSDIADIDDISFVIVDEHAAKELIASINAGIYPDYSDIAYQGETAERYQVKDQVIDQLANTQPVIETWQYSVSVRNGYDIPGCDAAVADMLASAGYELWEIGYARSPEYAESLIVYRDDTDRTAAEDIRARLGYGRVIPSLGRYSFDGNILVVVGGDFVG